MTTGKLKTAIIGTTTWL